MFLSIEHFAPLCYEVEALRTLFTNEYTKPIFEDWWNIRDSVLLINNMGGNTAIPLNTFYLTKSEYIVMIERVRDTAQVHKLVKDWIATQEAEIKLVRKDVRKEGK